MTLLWVLLSAVFLGACSHRRGLAGAEEPDAAAEGSGGRAMADADSSSASGGAPGNGGNAAAGGIAPTGSGGAPGAGGAPSAAGSYRVTVTVEGSGSVVSTPKGIDCPGTCTATFSTASVLLRSHIASGSSLRFVGWTGGGCPAGVVRNCTLNLTGDSSVKAAFVAITENLAFVTARSFATNAKTTSQYDYLCNDAATMAGLNTLSADGFVAFLSATSSLATARLGNARGWVRLDGKPVMDTVASALVERKVFNPVLYDETGVPVAATVWAMTGTRSDGTLDPSYTCADWTGSGNVSGGSADGGPTAWSSSSFGPCSQMHPLLCLGKTRTAIVTPVVASGRRIWITEALHALGTGQTPDAACQADRPTGVTTAVALIATPARAAADALVASSNYVRLDGTLVGTGAQIAAGALESGIWQHASGAYLADGPLAFTGSSAPGSPGTAETTCSNWTDSAMTSGATLVLGSADTLDRFWLATSTVKCEFSERLYCVQTAP